MGSALTPAYPLDDGLILLGPNRDRLHVLNATGRLIWEAHRAGRGLEPICAVLTKRYAVPTSQAELDVRAALSQWEAAGLLGEQQPVLDRGTLLPLAPDPVPPREDLPRAWNASRSYPIRHMVFPRYARGARTALRPLSPIEALQRLVASNSLVERPLIPDKVGELVAWLDEVPAWSLTFDALDEACPLVRELFAA